ncbi:hypothetical protein Q8A64_01540 [Oxalobacteraceae bacterium R-40]|uniref:Uncharacterized protein n=1 Tax=Keguizhuia sedimenti TaxID=3064264 RepID=A0ABU1BJB5_9BURK|nr:hypothetical protein [Oxalobacteraceae bacterium R-40]
MGITDNLIENTATDCPLPTEPIIANGFMLPKAVCEGVLRPVRKPGFKVADSAER